MTSNDIKVNLTMQLHDLQVNASLNIECIYLLKK